VSHATKKSPFDIVIEYSLLLIVGAVAAIIWANVDNDSYGRMAHTIHFVVNDIGMVFFFALATKEVVEAMLPGGALSSPRQAALPLLAAVGGMLVPAAIFAVGALGSHHEELMRGWAIPCATDIAFSYLVARMIFPKASPAIPFLLLLAIADDALGLIVLAIFYPSGPLAFGTLLAFMIPAVAAAWSMRQRKVTNFWAYLAVPGVLSWIGLYLGGIHAALALVPIVPFMPAARKDLGLFDPKEERRHDTLDRFEHAWKLPVQVMLFFFGLANAGVPLSSVGSATWLVLGGLIIGKPIGIVGMTLLGELAGLRRASGLDLKALLVLGVAAGIGFTVALFFATAAFAPGVVLDQAKMGALLSFLAAPLAIVLARLLGLRRTA
jgi:NhaA family Na+:H+ antiporter